MPLPPGFQPITLENLAAQKQQQSAIPPPPPGFQPVFGGEAPPTPGPQTSPEAGGGLVANALASAVKHYFPGFKPNVNYPSTEQLVAPGKLAITSAVEGLLHPVFTALKVTGIDYNKILEDAQAHYYKQLPEFMQKKSIPDVGVYWGDKKAPGEYARVGKLSVGPTRHTPGEMLSVAAGGTAQMAGPVEKAFEAGDLVVKSAKVAEKTGPIFAKILRGAIAGSLLGEGDPKETALGAAQFGLFEAVPAILGKIKDVHTRRKLEKYWANMPDEQKLPVVQSLATALKNNPKLTEAEAARMSPNWFEEAKSERVHTEQPSSVVVQNAPPGFQPLELPPGQGFVLRPKVNLKKGPPIYPEGAQYITAKGGEPSAVELKHRYKYKGTAQKAIDRLKKKGFDVSGYAVVEENGKFKVSKEPQASEPKLLALPPAQGFELKPGKPSVKLKKAPPTYPRGAQYVAASGGEPPAIELKYRYKYKKTAQKAIDRLKRKGFDVSGYAVMEENGKFKVGKEPHAEKLKAASQKAQADTGKMLKPGDKVNGVTLDTFVDMAAKNPDHALEHVKASPVPAAKLQEGLVNKGMKKVAEAPKAERPQVQKNLQKVVQEIPKAVEAKPKKPIASDIAPAIKGPKPGKPAGNGKNSPEKALKNMAEHELLRAARSYDNLYNEGGEGYNPYRDELDRRRIIEAKSNAATLQGKIDKLYRRLRVETGSIAREYGDNKKISALAKSLRSEIKKLEAQKEAQANAEFLEKWPKDVTESRRQAWNKMVHSGKFGVPGSKKTDVRAMRKQEKTQGWTMSDLKRAVELHKQLAISVFKNTEDAIKFGKKATPEQIKALASAYAENNKEVAALKKAGKLQEALEKSSRGQFYREAIEAAGHKVKQRATKPEDVIPGVKLYSGIPVDKIVQAAMKSETFSGLVNDARKFIAFLAPESISETARKGAALLRARLGEKTQAINMFIDRSKKARNAFDWLSEAQQLDIVNGIERGITDPNYYQWIPKRFRKTVTGYVAFRKPIMNKVWQELHKRGLLNVESYIDNYISHLWKDPDKAKAKFHHYFSAKRPLKGSQFFRKGRKIDFYSLGIELGLEPRFTNPIDIDTFYLNEAYRLITTVDMIEDLKKEGLWKFVRIGKAAPEGWKRVNDPISDVIFRSEAGPTIAGHYYCPEDIARLLNNHVSKGMYGRFKLYELARQVNNTANTFNLGVSLYHGTFSSITSGGHELALVWSRLTRGAISDAIKTSWRVTPAGLVRGVVKGNYYRRLYLHPELAKTRADRTAIAILKTANYDPKLDRYYALSAVEGFKRAIKRARLGGAAVRLPVSLIEKLAVPIQQHIVPDLKACAAIDTAMEEIARKKPKTLTEYKEIVSDSYNMVEDRFGQMTYDNLFWHRMLKDTLMILLRSVGWNWGDLREMSGGGANLGKLVKKMFIDGELPKQKDISNRLFFIISLPLVTAMWGGVYNYLHGHKPEKLLDYFMMPGKDGRKKMFASYLKDWLAAINESPLQMFKNKMSPVASAATDLITNLDYWKNEIYGPETWPQDMVKYLGKHFFVPFTVSQAQRTLEAGGSVEDAMEPFFGVINAPKYLTNTEAQNYIWEKFKAQTGVKFREMRDRLEWRRKARIEYRKTGSVSPETMQYALDHGYFSSKQAVRSFYRGLMLPSEVAMFRRLPWEIQAKALYKAKGAEKELLLRYAKRQAIDEYKKATGEKTQWQNKNSPRKHTLPGI